MLKKTIGLAAVAVVMLAGCSAQADTVETVPATSPATAVASATTAAAAPSSSEAAPEASAPADATAWAEAIEQPTTKKITTITEDNDPNNLIGRPGGYISAAVLKDSGADCDELGTSCGAMIEVYETAEEAQGRSDYIQGILKDNPVFGTEWHVVNGTALLRVTGELKPSIAEGYQSAFEVA